VVLTPKDESILVAYNIISSKVISYDGGTKIKLVVSSNQFYYGDCRKAGGFCQGHRPDERTGSY